MNPTGSVGDPNDFFRIRIWIRILFFRPIGIQIRLLSAPDPNAFGFGSESKSTLKTKSK